MLITIITLNRIFVCLKTKAQMNISTSVVRQAIMGHPCRTIKRQRGFNYNITKREIDRENADFSITFRVYNLKQIINTIVLKNPLNIFKNTNLRKTYNNNMTEHTRAFLIRFYFSYFFPTQMCFNGVKMNHKQDGFKMDCRYRLETSPQL